MTQIKKGYEWLESDVQIYNLLVDKQAEGDQKKEFNEYFERFKFKNNYQCLYGR